jgi:hypothetical protein
MGKKSTAENKLKKECCIFYHRTLQGQKEILADSPPFRTSIPSMETL